MRKRVRIVVMVCFIVAVASVASAQVVSAPGPVSCPWIVVGDHIEHRCPIPALSVVYDPEVTAAGKANAEEGLSLGYQYMAAQFGWVLDRGIVLRVTAGSASPAAFVSLDEIVVNTLSPVWVNASGANRRRIVATALAQVYQYRVGWTTTPAWLRNGAAEVIGWRAVFLGLVINDTTLVVGHLRMCQYWSVVNSQPVLGPLQGYETAASVGEGSGATNALSYLATETLIGEGPSIGKLKLVTNFNQLFVSPMSTFYSAFEQYRQQVLPNGWLPSWNFCEGVQ